MKRKKRWTIDGKIIIITNEYWVVVVTCSIVAVVVVKYIGSV